MAAGHRAAQSYAGNAVLVLRGVTFLDGERRASTSLFIDQGADRLVAPGDSGPERVHVARSVRSGDEQTRTDD